MDAAVAKLNDRTVKVRQVGAGVEWSTWLLTQDLTDRWGGLNYNGAMMR